MFLACRTAAKSGLRLQPLFCLCSTVVFTDQPRALQLFSAAVSPHTERCAGWLATPVRTRAYAVRFAHSNVASLNSSSHGLQLMTQAVAAAATLNISGCAWVGNVGDSTACHPQTLSKFWYSPKSMHIQVSSICCPMTTTLQLKLPRKLSKKHLYRAQTISIYRLLSSGSTRWILMLQVPQCMIISALLHSNSQGSKPLMQTESESSSCTATSS